MPKPRLLALAVALAVLSLSLDPTTLAASPYPYPGNPPEFALMKGDNVIQKGAPGSACWTYWSKTKHHWNSYCADAFSYYFPHRAVLVHAGSTLHIRLYNPQRPDTVKLGAFPGYDEGAIPGPGGNPIGKRQPVDRTLRPVERNDKTVAWDVFFRVEGPHRHYYLSSWVLWDRVPGTHISHGDVAWTFHVKTR